MPENLTLDFGLSSVTASPPAAPPAPATPATPPATSPARTAPTDAGIPTSEAAPATPAPAPGVDKIKIGDRTFSSEELNELSTFRAEQESRRLTLPANADAYKVELPADFTLPEGLSFQFKADDPLLGQGRQLMHDIDSGRIGGQEAFSRLLSLYAATQVQDMSRIQSAREAEVGKLGVNATARIDRVATWLRGVGGADAETLIKVLDYAPVAGTVMAFERMMQKWSSQGGSSFSQQHRSNPDDSKIAGYETMSFEQRRYAQDQRNRR